MLNGKYGIMSFIAKIHILPNRSGELERIISLYLTWKQMGFPKPLIYHLSHRLAERIHVNVAITKAISTRRMSFQCPCDVIPVLLFFVIPVSATWMTGEGGATLTIVIPLPVSGIYAKRYRE